MHYSMYSGMVVGKRKYREGCAVAHALDLVGERWSLIIVRELLLGPKRFTDLRSGIAGVSADVLSQRLRELIEAGIVAQTSLPPPAAAQIYELTSWGAELKSVVNQLARWGSGSPTFDPRAHSSVDSLVLSMQALFDPGAARGFAGIIALNIDGDHFTVKLSAGHIDISRGHAESAVGLLATSRDHLAAILYGGTDLGVAEARGDAVITGDLAAVQRFVSIFGIPTTADP
jgi:DNA-binding HxlR family transcriptional regulator